VQGLPVRFAQVAAGDFNGDGKPDIASLSTDNPCKCISILLGKGNGTFEDPVVTQPTFDVESIGIGDFNGDGKLDIATAGDFTVNILLGDGNGTFEYGASYPSPEAPESMAVADFNGDHKLDLATADTEGSSISVLLGNGDGTFETPVNYQIPFCAGITTADVNGDGQPDLVATSDYDLPNVSGIAVLLGNGDGSFRSPAYYSSGSDNSTYVVAADFNSDGKVDAAITNLHTNAIIVMLNAGTAAFSPTSLLVFKKQAVGTTSPAQKVTLTNTGKTELTISAMKAAGQFAMTSTCSKAVVPNKKSCTISVTFSPTSQGAKSGTITINDSASSKPQVIELSGTGT
jgi:large repetitive protein